MSPTKIDFQKSIIYHTDKKRISDIDYIITSLTKIDLPKSIITDKKRISDIDYVTDKNRFSEITTKKSRY